MNGSFLAVSKMTWLTCFCLVACDFQAAESPKAVAFARLPDAVQKTIQSQWSGGKLGEIERIEEDGEVTYDGEITIRGQERDFSISENGTLLSV
ncbi:MAG TPA: hypothetical protein VGH65_07765, partial [Verrucomicrobiaceae bacterium]